MLLLCIINNSVNITNTTSKNQYYDISLESLSENLQIGLKATCDILKVTTQQGIWQAADPITRRYQIDTMLLQIHQLKATVFTDTYFISIKSLAQYTCHQSYSAENFIHLIPIKEQTDATDSLMSFAHDVGKSVELVSDHDNLLSGP